MNKNVFANETDVYEEIELWLLDDPYESFLSYMTGRIIGQKDIDLICSNIYMYLKSVLNGKVINSNTIITAGSGTGKTETYRALKDYFKHEIPSLPVFMVDTTQLTPTGYKGSNLEDAFSPLFDVKGSGGIVTAPPAIVFLDEFDKRIMGVDEVFGPAVQYNLLTILEGGMISTTKRQRFTQNVDTSNVLFFGMGSFDAFKEKKTKHHGIGFNESETNENVKIITPEVLLEAGAATELVGRFPIVINYDDLTDEVLDKIIDKISYSQAFAFDCDVIIKDCYRQELKSMVNTKFGCRTISNKMQFDVLKMYTNAMKDNNKNDVLEIILDKTHSYKWRKYSAKEMARLKELDERPNNIEIDQIKDELKKILNRRVISEK